MLSVLKRREINFSRGIMFTNGTRCLHTDHWELILAATPEDNKKLSAKKCLMWDHFHLSGQSPNILPMHLCNASLNSFSVTVVLLALNAGKARQPVSKIGISISVIFSWF